MTVKEFLELLPVHKREMMAEFLYSRVPCRLGMKTKVSIKVKGTPKGVKKALEKIVVPDNSRPLREADFRQRQKAK